jgi:amidase
MATWILRLDPGPGDGPLVAVKDAIDVAGVPTTVGCAAVADTAGPAAADAACVERLRQAGARIAGKANLHELAFGGTGINPWYGTPRNPLDPTRIPGGSSSGSAVAVATGEADVGIGTDTAGSVRTPSACCGTVGLKTTWGRIPLDGVWPLAPTLDTVGPLARDVAGVVRGMALLEPGFAPAASPAPVIGRVRLPGTDPVVDGAIDRLLAAAGIPVVEVALPGWDAADQAARTVLFGEAWRSDRAVYERAPIASGTTPGPASRRAGASTTAAWRRHDRTATGGGPSWPGRSSGHPCWPCRRCGCSPRRSRTATPTPATPTPR